MLENLNLHPSRHSSRLPSMAALLLLLLGAGIKCADAQEGVGGWKTGRVTYFGAPEKFARAYDPSRGEGSFGILAYGACGYTNEGGKLAVPEIQASASASASEDYPGSCGRCYDIKCQSIPVQDNSGNPIEITNGYYEGDKWRPYLPAINPDVTDTKGRKFPGKAANNSGSQTAECYDEGKVIRIRITDSCPCQQSLKAGAPGVAEDTTRTQQWCCDSKATHFDISYYAFESLAHPLYGVMMIQYKPVDCESGEALPFSPGYIDKKFIYSGGARPGWSWFPYKASGFELSVAGASTPAGNPSTCMSITPGGGLQFKCRECYKDGYQPFAGATAIRFYMRSKGDAAEKPNLKMILQKAETGNYCSGEPSTGDIDAKSSTGGWFQITVPISAFNCPGGGVDVSQMTQFEFQNSNEKDVPVCIGDIEIVR